MIILYDSAERTYVEVGLARVQLFFENFFFFVVLFLWKIMNNVLNYDFNFVNCMSIATLFQLKMYLFVLEENDVIGIMKFWTYVRRSWARACPTFFWKLFFFRGSVSLKNYEQCIKLWFQFCKLYVNCHFISIENVFVCSRRKWRHRNYEILNVRTSKLGSRVSNFSWKLFFLILFNFILFYFEMEL